MFEKKNVHLNHPFLLSLEVLNSASVYVNQVYNSVLIGASVRVGMKLELRRDPQFFLGKIIQFLFNSVFQRKAYSSPPATLIRKKR